MIFQKNFGPAPRLPALAPSRHWRHRRAMKSPRLRLGLVTCSLALIAGLTGAPALADVMPPGQRYVPVEHRVTGVAKLKDYAVYLVTTSDRTQRVEALTAGIQDGPLKVPSGYRYTSYLVALTPSQVKTLDGLRKGAWKDPEDERTEGREKGPLLTFFRRDDVAASPPLHYRDTVPTTSPLKSIVNDWQIEGVKDHKLVLVKIPGRSGSDAGPERREDAWPWPMLATSAASVLLAVFALGSLRRRSYDKP